MSADGLRSAAAAGSLENPKKAWDQDPAQGDRKVKPADVAEKPAGPDKAEKAGESGKAPKARTMRSMKTRTGMGGSAVKWQWEHKTGFRDYSEEDSERIERHFQLGAWVMRLKAGKDGKVKPKEIYFHDMVQYDPSSTNAPRKIQRVPRLTRAGRILRAINTCWLGWNRGDEQWWRAKSMQYFIDQRSGQDVRDEFEILADTYNIESICFRIVQSWTFHGIMITAILTNACWLFIDADFNPGTTFADTPWVFIIVDNIFCVYFLLELIVRFRAFRSWRHSLQDSWFVLDLSLVILMVFETWILQLGIYIAIGSSRTSGVMDKFVVLRPLRLLRLTRITRLFKVFPQLFVLLKGVTQAMRSLVYTLLMLLVLMFMFGMVLKSFAENQEELIELGMDSVGGAMWVLLVNGTFMDAVGDVLAVLKDVHGAYAAVMLLFIFLSNLTMLNMLIGILCEVISRVNTDELENAAKDELEEKVKDIFECYDLKSDGQIGKQEFSTMMSNPDLRLILEEKDIDPNDLAKLEDVLFEEEIIDGEPALNDDGTPIYSELSFDAFLEKVIQLRGGNMATVTDVVELRTYLNRKFAHVEERLPAICERPISAQSGARPYSRPSADAAAPSPDQTVQPSQEVEVPLPGQIQTETSGTTFQEKVLDQLQLLRVSQEMLRGEVADLRSKVQALEQAPRPPTSEVSA